MRVTEQVVVIEAFIGGLLADARSWTVWRADGDKRKLHEPTFVACHVPSRQTLAVFVRPRRLYPSERPDTSWLPADWVAVVWWPGMLKEVRAWLAVPTVTEPPGVVDRGEAE